MALRETLRVGTKVRDRAGLAGTIVKVINHNGQIWYDVRFAGGIAVRFPSEIWYLSPERE